MRKALTMIVCLLFACTVTAQTDFHEDKTFAEIITMAKEQAKPVFVDCYTTWCGPCKRMAREVFPQKEAADYFNTKFVCWKIDMEKGEGPGLAEKYDVSAYPTFLVLESDGSLMGRYCGAAPLEEFITKIDAILTEQRGLPWYKKQFEGGQRDETFVREYLDLLHEGYMRAEVKQVIATLLEGVDPQRIATDSALFKTFTEGAFNADDDLFLQVYRYRDDVLNHQGAEAVQMLDQRWQRAAEACMRFDGKTYQSFDADRFETLKQKMAAYGVPDIQKIVDATLVANATYAGDYPTLIEFLERDVKTGGTIWTDHRDLHTVLGALVENCGKDKKVKKLIQRSISQRIEQLNREGTDIQTTYLVGGVYKTAVEYFTDRYNEILNKLKSIK